MEVPTPQEAARHEFTSKERDFMATLSESHLRGGPKTTRQKLSDLIHRLRPDELMVDTPLYEISERVESLGLLAGVVLATAR